MLALVQEQANYALGPSRQLGFSSAKVAAWMRSCRSTASPREEVLKSHHPYPRAPTRVYIGLVGALGIAAMVLQATCYLEDGLRLQRTDSVDNLTQLIHVSIWWTSGPDAGYHTMTLAHAFCVMVLGPLGLSSSNDLANVSW